MDISSLRERKNASEMTVSELNSYIKNIFDNDKALSAVSVRGEISNLTYHRTGHIYFSLKDEGGQVKAIMFRSSAERLKFMPENGMKVIVRCSVSVYTAGGSYQLYVTSIQPDGIGALYLAYEQLKSKLAAEGLFSEEFKRPIPMYPEKIGVITSPTGAAVRDIINVTSRRYPSADIYIYPSLVQGDGAEDNLIKALEYFESTKLVDVIIIGRGGGSIEDLWAFNGERLAYKIFSLTVPVISAVGHETDFTICDFVADLRAPTPSAAAELAVPDHRELLMRLLGTHERITNALIRIAERSEEKLLGIKSRALFSDPEILLSAKTDRVSELSKRCTEASERLIEKKFNELRLIAGKVDALSPLSTLSRGYSVATFENKSVRCVDDVSVGDEICVRVSDGEIVAEVNGKRNMRRKKS